MVLSEGQNFVTLYNGKRNYSTLKEKFSGNISNFVHLQRRMIFESIIPVELGSKKKFQFLNWKKISPLSSSRNTEGPKGSEYCESHEYPGIHDCTEGPESSEGPQGFEGSEVPEGPKGPESPESPESPQGSKGPEGSDVSEGVSESCRGLLGASVSSIRLSKK